MKYLSHRRNELSALTVELRLDFTDDMPELKLGEPARIIDCGPAGNIELHTSHQVNVARRAARVDEYINNLKTYAEAPKLARQIIQRAIAKKAQITTKLGDLPPLPYERN